jgi:folate-binding Fe-S cluster repair protein YgfZ
LIGGENGRLHCLYSHLINSNGRTLVDVFVYKPSTESTDVSINRNLVLAPFHVDSFGSGGLETDQLLIECPSKMGKALARMFFAMKIRKKVTIEEYDTNIWSLIPHDTGLWKEHHQRIQETSSSDIVVSKDPRIPVFGFRVVSSLPIDNISSLSQFLGLQDEEVQEASLSEYQRFCYSLGVGEGDTDHPEGFAYPLECNADFLNGVSFQKGMFTGDWITGRNYRKGVKSRLMPIIFPGVTDKQLKSNQVAPWTQLSLEGESVGVIRNLNGNIGLACIEQRLLFNKYLKKRSNQYFELKHVLSNLSVLSYTPSWWRLNNRRLPSNETPVTLIPDGRLASDSLVEVK